MNNQAVLSNRETEIAEYLAWGLEKKKVADDLCISTRTVETTAKNIYRKLGIQKATELCVWWFCNKCGVSPLMSPLVRRTVFASVMLLLMINYEFRSGENIIRSFRPGRTQSVRASRGGFRRDNDLND